MKQITKKQQLWQPFFCVEIHARFVLGCHLRFGHSNNILRTSFFLSLWILKNEMSHESDAFKVQKLHPTLPNWGRGRVPPTIIKYSLDYPCNMWQCLAFYFRSVISSSVFMRQSRVGRLDFPISSDYRQ